jgi:hypothetical protein
LSSTDLQARLIAYRRKTYRPGRVRSRAEAIEFVRRRGFAYFWPIQGVELPSLWVAVAGERPVPSEHDDAGHVTWRWKDSLLGARRWYYAKLLRKKATLVSLEVAPYFYALTENYGSPEDDYLIQYEEGRLTQEAKRIYEALLKGGPLDTVALRKAAWLSSDGSKSTFDRALLELQADMKVLPVGVAEAGAWRYAFVYDLVARHLPEIPERARAIAEPTARTKLLELYLLSVGAARLETLRSLFSWGKGLVEAAAEGLVGQDGRSPRIVEHGGWVGLSSLLTARSPATRQAARANRRPASRSG